MWTRGRLNVTMRVNEMRKGHRMKAQRRTIWGQYAKVVSLPPGRKGMKAVGTTLTRPERSRVKRAKGQYDRSGLAPRGL